MGSFDGYFYALETFLKHKEELQDISDADEAKKEARLADFKSLDQVVKELDLDV